MSVNNLEDFDFKNPLIRCLGEFKLGGVTHDIRKRTRRDRMINAPSPIHQENNKMRA